MEMGMFVLTMTLISTRGYTNAREHRQQPATAPAVCLRHCPSNLYPEDSRPGTTRRRVLTTDSSFRRFKVEISFGSRRHSKFLHKREQQQVGLV